MLTDDGKSMFNFEKVFSVLVQFDFVDLLVSMFTDNFAPHLKNR